MNEKGAIVSSEMRGNVNVQGKNVDVRSLTLAHCLTSWRPC